jgi:capsular polysaccharide transport system ATP-binding protein
MISVRNACKGYRIREGRKIVLDNVSIDIPSGRNFGILGANGAGKSTLIRLLAGTEDLDSGAIMSRRRVSFPVGFSGTFHPELSGRENVVFLARVYGADIRQTLAYVEEFTCLGEYFREPVGTYSSGMTAKLAFGASLAIDFDTYLIDEVTAVGDARFQERCRRAFEKRMEYSDIIMVSHDLHTIRTYCDAGALLSDGKLTLFDDIEGAIDAHSRRMHGAPASDHRNLAA